MDLKNNFKNKLSNVRSLLENNYNFELIIERNIWSLSQFSKMCGKDFLFVKKNKII